MALALTRNDILVRARKTMCCFSRFSEGVSQKLSNGTIPCKEDIRKIELLSAYIEVLRCYEPPISEVLATGSFTLTGTTGTIWITVNAVPITTAAVTFATSLATTATAIATAATADVSSPEYTATATGAVVTITAAAGSGIRPNGFLIQSIATGDMAITGVVNMTGGVTARVDADNCFTLARAKGIFNHIETLTDITFAPSGYTYFNPNTIVGMLENLTANDGTNILTEGTAAVAAAPIQIRVN